MSGATAAEFNKWRAHAKTVDDDALAYIISDCRQAQNAMRGWNPERENYYADQGMTYVMERLRREGKLRRR